jgi:Fur family transcriptional regulator, ferric uptake regulator
MRKPPLGAGQRNTSQRRLVWDTITALGPHCTADEIAARIQAERPGFPLSTVYRALEAFTIAGSLRPVRLGAGATHYEIAGEDHQHAICERCEGILHLEDSLLRELEVHLEELHHFHPRRTDVLVFGICAVCSRAADGAARPKVRKRNLEHVHYSSN